MEKPSQRAMSALMRALVGAPVALASEFGVELAVDDGWGSVGLPWDESADSEPPEDPADNTLVVSPGELASLLDTLVVSPAELVALLDRARREH